ncbi:hypothetical protein NHG33_06510 [Aerococcaceae bacterium NML130460]|nr:hypothetical protein [Aerococcaceae bacterium NML130460]
MKEILINNEEAQRLIKMIKTVIESVNGTIREGDTGVINFIGSDNHSFQMKYYYSSRKKTFNFRELKHNYNLIRINLDNNFHKNSDGTKISGNRINIFSEEEFYQKGDGVTHQKCYPLPFESIRNSDDFLNVMGDILKYTSVNQIEKIHLNIQESLL